MKVCTPLQSVLRGAAGQLIMRGRGGSLGTDFFLEYEDLLSLDDSNPRRAVKKHVLDKQQRVSRASGLHSELNSSGFVVILPSVYLRDFASLPLSPPLPT